MKPKPRRSTPRHAKSRRSGKTGAAERPPATRTPESIYARIYDVIRRVPRGRVVTYGQVAWLAGIPNGARQVGYALRSLRGGTTVPWHRVINSQGGISVSGASATRQRTLLEREGVRFNLAGRIPLSEFQWRVAPHGARSPRPTRARRAENRR